MVDRHSNEEEPEYKKAVFSLPQLETIDKYTTQWEKTAILNLEEALKEKNFRNQLVLTCILLRGQVFVTFSYVV